MPKFAVAVALRCNAFGAILMLDDGESNGRGGKCEEYKSALSH